MDIDDNDLQEWDNIFTAPTSCIDVSMHPAKISEREEDVVPRQELHKRITREEEKRWMTADVEVLAEEGIEIWEKERERERERERKTRVREMIHRTNWGSQREDAKVC